MKPRQDVAGMFRQLPEHLRALQSLQHLANKDLLPSHAPWVGAFPPEAHIFQRPLSVQQIGPGLKVNMQMTPAVVIMHRFAHFDENPADAVYESAEPSIINGEEIGKVK